MHGQVVQMPNHSAEFRRCLVDCDVDSIRALWKHIYPSMPLPDTHDDTVICIHMTRTATERLPFRFRAYSHSWLTERNIRSLLPDDLRPRAERMYPRVVSAVGFCCATFGNKKTDYHNAVSSAVCDKIEEMYADGIEDPVLVKAEMKIVHDRLRKQK